MINQWRFICLIIVSDISETLATFDLTVLCMYFVTVYYSCVLYSIYPLAHNVSSGCSYRLLIYTFRMTTSSTNSTNVLTLRISYLSLATIILFECLNVYNKLLTYTVLTQIYNHFKMIYQTAKLFQKYLLNQILCEDAIKRLQLIRGKL